MTRLTIRLRAEEYALAKKEAKALGISLEEFVRRAVRDRLASSQGPPWMRYAGLVESGVPESSASIDEIIYGSSD